MFIGMGSPIQTLPISAAALREIDLIGVFRYANTYEEAIKLVSSGNPLLPELSKLVTQRFKEFDCIPEAFAIAGRVKDDEGNLVLKVVVDTTDS
jgi:L-iditol 2-dehydrogenase